MPWEDADNLLPPKFTLNKYIKNHQGEAFSIKQSQTSILNADNEWLSINILSINSPENSQLIQK